MPASSRNNYTPHDLPLKPIVTFSPSTITGTLRIPSEYFSIMLNFSGSDNTFMYSTSFLFAKAARAASVKGQLFFP